MVALYISNTKKVLMVYGIWFLIYTVGCLHIKQNKMNKCEEISDYLELSVHQINTNISFNDTLVLPIRFKNISTDTLEFYPEALTYLAKPSAGFAFQSKVIKKALDVTKVEQLLPNEKYVTNLTTKIDSTFFNVGSNELILAYRVAELEGKNKKYNKLCGYLETEKFIVFVNN